jgi:phage terminase small subunit
MQRLFVAEYLIDHNAAAAARRAGYSERTARKIGQENLTKPDIRAAIEKATEERLARLGVRADLAGDLGQSG